ncbi:MAG: PCRF domain-containing protein, partial [Clostridia bacterium]|nr:PCRF domain-containing protein [Clostridia bacterium]
MLEKLKGIEKRYETLGLRLSEPEAMQDMAAWREMAREHAALEEIVTAYHGFCETCKQAADCRAMLEESMDAEMKALVHEELAALEHRAAEEESALRALLLPKDPNDERDVILEIRAGTGGDEASLFGADLLRMYLRYAERNG